MHGLLLQHASLQIFHLQLQGTYTGLHSKERPPLKAVTNNSAAPTRHITFSCQLCLFDYVVASCCKCCTAMCTA